MKLALWIFFCMILFAQPAEEDGTFRDHVIALFTPLNLWSRRWQGCPDRGPMTVETCINGKIFDVGEWRKSQRAAEVLWGIK